MYPTCQRLLRSKAHGGFTLLEVLVALVLLSFLMLMLYGSLYASVRHWRAGEVRALENDDKRLVLPLIRRLIGETMPLLLADRQGTRVMFLGADASLQFVSRLPAHHAGGGIHFLKLKAEAGELLLKYTPLSRDQAMFEEDIFVEAKSVSLLGSIRKLDLDYYGRNTPDTDPAWHDDWDSETFLPELVRITVHAHEPDTWPAMVIAVRARAVRDCRNLPCAERKGMSAVKRGQHGVALVLALWLLTLLTVLAAGYGYAMRTETKLTIHGVELAGARATAEAGVWLALADLLQPEPERRWQTDGTLYLLDFVESRIQLRIQDEAGRIDLNTADEALLRGLLEKAAQPGDDVDYLLNAILDWPDPDSRRRNPGAGDADYAHAGYDARNVPFNGIEELRLVAGMTNGIFTSIYPTLTIHSGQAGINPLAAPREVLLALPGADEEHVDTFIRNRRNREAPTAPPGMDTRFFGGERGAVFNINSVGMTGHGKLELDVVISLNNASGLPYSVLSWREAMPEHTRERAADAG